MEIFKTIQDYSGYEISNIGRVRNSKNGRILKFYLSDGYSRINLKSDSGKIGQLLVHRLVMNTFDKPQPELTVNHINYIRTDNRLENLQWMTREDNIRNKRESRECLKSEIKELYNSCKFSSLDEFYEKVMNL